MEDSSGNVVKYYNVGDILMAKPIVLGSELDVEGQENDRI